MKNNTKWKDFEDSTHKVIQSLNPQATVIKNVFIEGKLSKVLRQVDVQLVKPEEYDFIAFECKDYNRALDVPIIEAFATKLKDIQAKKGAIVSNSPFTQASQNMAGELDIDLLNLVDTSNVNIRGKLFAGLLLEDISVKGFRLRLSISAPTGRTFTQEPTQLLLADEEGARGTAYEIFAKLWNDKTSLSRVPGVYEYIPPSPNTKKIISLEGELVPLDKLSFVYEVIERYYLGKIEIIDAQGLFNVKETSFQTKSVTTQKIAPCKFEKPENEITKEQAEQAKGEITFGLSVVSIFPEKYQGDKISSNQVE